MWQRETGSGQGGWGCEAGGRGTLVEGMGTTGAGSSLPSRHWTVSVQAMGVLAAPRPTLPAEGHGGRPSPRSEGCGLPSPVHSSLEGLHLC